MEQSHIIEHLEELTKFLIRPTRILIVEDDIDCREILVKIISRHNYEIDQCDNGKVALEVIKSKIYDIAIIDIGLPGGRWY